MIVIGSKQITVRLRFIDAYFIMYGSISRSVIREVFGISPAAATRALKHYRAVAGDGVELLGRERGGGQVWFRSPTFKPLKELWPDGSLGPGAFLRAVGDVYSSNIARLGRESQKDKPCA